MKKVFAVLLAALISGFFGVTVLATNVIPKEGGVVRVNGTTVYSFTPGHSGFWAFETSDNGEDDPYLSVYDNELRLIAEDDDSGGNYNALIMVPLESGKTYRVNAGFYSGNHGSYTLNVKPMVISRLSATGGGVRVSDETYYSFTPTETGLWSFYTTENINSDPSLWLYDMAGRLINLNDDGGEGLNSFLSARLIEGVEYHVRAGNYSNAGTYLLHTAYVPAVEISGFGGEYTVKNDLFLSFKPQESGFWVFSTSENGESDPYLWLYDDTGLMAEDDDSGGDYNAKLLVPLEAGVQYFLHAGFYIGENGKYVLTAQPAPQLAPVIQNPTNLFEANQHRADSPAWMLEKRFYNLNRSYGETNGTWEAAVRELLADKNVLEGDYSSFHLFSRPVNHRFSLTAKNRLNRAAESDLFFNRLPFSRNYISDIIFEYLGFNFTSGDFNGGLYIGMPDFSTINLDIDINGINWAVSVLGHEFGHAMAFGESLSDLIEESLMGWEFSSQGEGAGEVNPVENTNGLMYNSSFDRTLERFAGPEEFWFYASFSNHAYSELWNKYLGDVVNFREMQVLRSLMRECDNHLTLAIKFEQAMGMDLDELSEELLKCWRTIFSEAHPTNNFDIKPPSLQQQQQALLNFNMYMEKINEFALQFNIVPYTAVLPDIQQNHRHRVQNG